MDDQVAVSSHLSPNTPLGALGVGLSMEKYACKFQPLPDMSDFFFPI